MIGKRSKQINCHLELTGQPLILFSQLTDKTLPLSLSRSGCDFSLLKIFKKGLLTFKK